MRLKCGSGSPGGRRGLGVGLFRVEIRQGHHGENLASVRVHNKAAAAHRLELVDLRLDLAVEHMLQAHVDRQRQRLPPPAR
jgi:hypothetical protein